MQNIKGFTPLDQESPIFQNGDEPRKACGLLRGEGNVKFSYIRKARALARGLMGFTLIELMLVVIILGILVAMVVPRLVGRGEQARVQAAITDIRANIGTALDLYELDNGRYPEELQDLMKDPGESKAPNWQGPYLKRKPLDPWGREYVYRTPGQQNPDYDLYSYGPDGVEGGGDDITNWEEES